MTSPPHIQDKSRTLPQPTRHQPHPTLDVTIFSLKPQWGPWGRALTPTPAPLANFCQDTCPVGLLLKAPLHLPLLPRPAAPP